MTLRQLEHRLATLERKVATITGQAQGSPASDVQDVNAWIDEIHGTFTDNASYRQAERLGRQWRKVQSSSSARARKTSSK